MDRGQRPGGAFGHTTGAELDEVGRYLSGLVKQYDLPEKVMVYHQVARSVVRKESGLKHHDGVAMIKSVDGLGHPGPKTNTYRGQQIEAGVRARRLQTVFHRRSAPSHDPGRRCLV
jgi:hypothetical protein